MANFQNEQKQPGRKNYPKDVNGYDKTPRVKNNDPEFKTSEGDLGILRIKEGPIPLMSKAPTKTGDGLTNNVTMKMRKIMKAQGMLD